MSLLSKRVQALKPSPTLALAAQAKALKDTGVDVISLSVGEPDWDTFEEIKEAGIQAIREGQTKYTPANGLPQLRQAVAKEFFSDFGVEYGAHEVTVASGAKFVIFSALQALIDPGDEVIIPAPYWVSYPTMVELAGGRSVIIPCGMEQGFKLSPRDLESHIGPKTKMVILNSPSNPTGGMYSEEELKALAVTLKKHPHVVVLSDDIYNRLVFNTRGLAPHILEVAPELKERCVSVNGVSKTYSMTGWRIGWALGPSPVIEAMNNYQSQSTSCAAAFSQVASVAALAQSQGSLQKALEQLKQRRDFAVNELEKVSELKVFPPDGAFYLWVALPGGDSKKFAQELLQSESVALVPGVEFGLEGFVRISYALQSERMKEAVRRIQRFVDKYNF